MNMPKPNMIFMLIFSSILVSCGDSSSSGSGNSGTQSEEGDREAESLAVDGSNIQGRYLAKFTTLNPHVVGTIPGSAQLIREDNRLSAFVRLFAGSPSIAHFQNVHAGTRCPTINDDTNGDGFLDIQETMNVVGPVIIPLDWDIGSQLSANRSWPKAFPNGSYEYMKVTRFDRFWDDLKSEDRNPNDNITKLQPDEGLQLNGKVVIIQGVDETKTLPETVAGYDRWKNFQTLPIVCGIFSPYTEDPGVVYEEGIPGPVAPVVEGQDRPAEPGEGEDPGTGEVITGGPSNEAGSNESSSENSGSESDGTGTSNPEPREPRPEPRVPTPERPETETNPDPDTDSPQPTPEPDTSEEDGNSESDEDNDEDE